MKHLQHGYILTILWFHQVTLPVCWCWNSHEATMLSFPNRLGIFTGRSSFLKPSPPQRSSLPLYSSLKNEQEVAKAALLKVLKRQRVELQETERLLEELSALEVINSTTTSTQIQSLDKEDYGTATYADRDSYPNGTDFSSARTRVKDVPTIAQSMLAGVDYGFVSRSEGCSRNYEYNNEESTFVGDMGPPGNVFSLGSQQFMRNLNAMVGEYKDEENMALTAKQKQLQTELKKLTLNSTEIWEREKSRGPIVAPWVIKGPYYILCYILDVAFEHSYVPSRFFLLETVARMPYFTYITMLHLYETLGFWRRSADIKRIHFAEEWNEFHHLLIMESIGGDQAWWVRFTAQHSAIVYFFVLSLLWSVSPSLSYKFSELLETHAVDTYGTFIDENEDLLKQLPPSLAATDYYTIGVVDPMFGEYQTTSNGNIRKPGIGMNSLYDVFVAIRQDEGDHVSTMKSCLDPAVAVLSPSLESRAVTGVALAAIVASLLSGGDFLADSGFIGGLDDTIASETMMGGLIGAAANLVQSLGATLEEGSDLAAEADGELQAVSGLASMLPFFKENAIKVLEEILKFLRFL